MPSSLVAIVAHHSDDCLSGFLGGGSLDARGQRVDSKVLKD